MKHKNSGNCAYCETIFGRFPGFYAALKDWFKEFQHYHPEAHISCAGRGRQDQEALLIRKATRAAWGKSAHNFNAAIDLFEMGGTSPSNIYEPHWFESVLKPQLPKFVTWYGAIGAPFPELPHVEVTEWRSLAHQGVLKLVE